LPMTSTPASVLTHMALMTGSIASRVEARRGRECLEWGLRRRVSYVVQMTWNASAEVFWLRICQSGAGGVVSGDHRHPSAKYAGWGESLTALRPLLLHDTRVDMAVDLPDDPIYLLQQIAGGDRDAFRRFYDRYATLAFTFALRLLGSQSDAEDLVQEIFLQVWRQAQAYSRERGTPEAWLITMTRSRAIDKLRSIRRRGMAILTPNEPSGVESVAQAERPTQAPEVKLTVEGVLGKLPEAQRLVLELAYFDGLTQTEIAARLGEPLGTVKSRMRAGLERLRGFLGAETTGKSI
jgi:RNA polymerase sigma-70 factor (ECF subfamily)